MISYIQIDNLTKSFGDSVLFSDITFGVFEGDKIGLIAKNGSGKSTLLKIIAGKESKDSGIVTFRNGLSVGYLEQVPEFPAELSIIEACLEQDTNTAEAIKKYEEAIKGGDATEIENAISLMDHSNAWNVEDRFMQILSKLKITDFKQKIGNLSGGQVKRVALAQLLIQEPDLLMLDEPTNHLDLDMIEWLEGYLSSSRSTILMVTHDRYFLDKVCNQILEIDNQRIYSYKGNYNYYLAKREERIEASNNELSRVRNLLRTELDWMRRQPQARGSKAKYRIDAFYDLKDRAQKTSNDSTIELNMKSSYIGSKIFEAHNVCKKYGDKVILNDFNYTFSRYEKLGIVGDNGVGKSTFIKMLLGIVSPDSGVIDVGETIKYGYYSQDGIQFDETKKVIDAVRDIAEDIVISDKERYSASQFLNYFLFTPSTQQKFIYKLSGGEKRRLYLATVLMKNPNFLILDEPTNDLDIITLNVLESYLASFKGCVIVVSHDRFFMNRVVDHIFAFEGNGVVKDFPGDYDDYRQWKQQTEKEEKEKQNATAKPKTQLKPQLSKSTNKLTFKEKMEFKQLDGEIAELESEKKELEQKITDTTLSPNELMNTSTRLGDIIDLLDEKSMRWLELSEKE